MVESLLQIQHELFADLCDVRDLPTTLQLCLDAAMRVTGMECGGIYLADEAGGYDLTVSVGLSDAFVAATGHHRPDDPPTQAVLKGRPIYLKSDDFDPSLQEALHRERLLSGAVIPICHGGKVIGSLNVASRSLEDLPATRRASLETIAAGAALLIGRARSDEALRQSEARYRAVVEDQTEVICRFTGAGTITFANEVYCRLFARSCDELVGQTWQPIAVTDDLPLIERMLGTLSPSNPVVVIENRVHAGDGQIRWMQFVNRGFFDAQGLLTEIQCVGRDITDRKQVEAALEQKNIALRELVEQIAAEKSRIHDDIVANIEEVILPILGRLSLNGPSQEHVDLLRHHLNDIMSTYSRGVVRQRVFHLTPRETEICDMVKAGMTSKEVAAMLGLSVQTVLRHRRNIRRRLKLTGEKENLASFLAGC